MTVGLHSHETTISWDVTGTVVAEFTYTSDCDVTNFTVDPIDNSGLPQVLVERDAADAIIASHVYGDDLIRMQRGSANHCYHADGIGNTRLLTDSTGAVSDTYVYDAFGNLIDQTGTTTNDYPFKGGARIFLAKKSSSG